MKFNIYLVEDEDKTGEFLKKALEEDEDYTFQVDLVKDGKEAIDKYINTKYDLIILDLKLPNKTGDEVLEVIRKKSPYTSVMVFTNYEEPPIMRKLINLGVDGYLKKGADADLWDTVQKIKDKLKPMNEIQRHQLLASLPI